MTCIQAINFACFPFYSSSDLEKISLEHVTKEDLEYLRDQTSLPYLPWKDDFTTEELARYLSNPASFAICKDRPAVSQRNAMFLIDREIPTSEDQSLTTSRGEIMAQKSQR